MTIMTKMSKSIFHDLRTTDVVEFIEQKGKFNYLSWADAVDQLLLKYPESKFETKKFGNLPFMIFPDGSCMVEVSVTINGIERSEMLPVLNHGNKPITNPNSFQINTSIKRCLAKAISLHGMGLFIYRGEDLPPVDGALKDELIELLKVAGKLTPEFENIVEKLDTKSLIMKINEYKQLTKG